MHPELVNELYKKDWVVFAKRPFNGPQSVIEYLGRYTHKIAISNHRIKKHIGWKGYFFLQRLSCSSGNQRDVVGCFGIYTAFCHAYFAERFCAHTALWYC